MGSYLRGHVIMMSKQYLLSPIAFTIIMKGNSAGKIKKS